VRHVRHLSWADPPHWHAARVAPSDRKSSGRIPIFANWIQQVTSFPRPLWAKTAPATRFWHCPVLGTWALDCGRLLNMQHGGMGLGGRSRKFYGRADITWRRRKVTGQTAF
jgi:hypothetical protein